MYMAQTLNAERSCQNAINEFSARRATGGLNACSTSTAAFCRARKRLPQNIVSSLVCFAGQAMTASVPLAWTWQGRPVRCLIARRCRWLTHWRTKPRFHNRRRRNQVWASRSVACWRCSDCPAVPCWTQRPARITAKAMMSKRCCAACLIDSNRVACWSATHSSRRCTFWPNCSSAGSTASLSSTARVAEVPTSVAVAASANATM